MGQRAAALNTRIRIHTSNRIRSCSQGDTHTHTHKSLSLTHTHTHTQTNKSQTVLYRCCTQLIYSGTSLTDMDIIGPE